MSHFRSGFYTADEVRHTTMQVRNYVYASWGWLIAHYWYVLCRWRSKAAAIPQTECNKRMTAYLLWPPNMRYFSGASAPLRARNTRHPIKNYIDNIARYVNRSCLGTGFTQRNAIDWSVENDIDLSYAYNNIELIQWFCCVQQRGSPRLSIVVRIV